MTNEQLDAIKAREKAATPGPWTYETSQQMDINDCKYDVVPADGSSPAWKHYLTIAFRLEKEDAEFVAYAREDIPALIAALEETEKERLYYQDMHESWLIDEQKMIVERDQYKKRAEKLEDINWDNFVRYNK